MVRIQPRLWAQVVPAAAILGVFWLALPVPLPRLAAGRQNEPCLAASASAIPTLERCHELYPDDVEVLADLGGAYEAADQNAQAEGSYQRALTIDPAYADLRLRLGGLMLRRGALGDARFQAEAGLRVQPNRQALRDLLENTRATTDSRQP